MWIAQGSGEPAGILIFDAPTTPKPMSSIEDAFAVPPSMRHLQTAFYSYRMMKNFGPDTHYLADLKQAPGPVTLLVGSLDQMFRPHAFAPLLEPVRPDLTVTVVPGMNHMDMITKPAALDAITAAADP
ncbi:MAG: alpha/beta fold hydrolase [Steroidobacteraceae bacterium]